MTLSTAHSTRFVWLVVGALAVGLGLAVAAQVALAFVGALHGL